ncbi:MAG: choice-of-anchor Q domain-containing protein [Blastocatellia bacterium]
MNRTTFHHRKTIWALSLILLTIAAITISFASWRVLAASAANTIIYVVPGGVGNGSSWAQGKDLASALAGAASGTDLWVKTGTYKPTTTSDRNATFTLKNGVALYGGFAGTETQLSQRNPSPATNNTVLSGDLNGDDGANFTNIGDNSYHVATGSGTNNTAVLNGFTIRGGNANGSFPQNSGGGMYNDSGSPTLTNVTFSDNSARLYGGGLLNDSSSPTLMNVTFSGNSAVQGGGMFNFGNSGSLTLTNVTFSRNSAGFGGGMRNDRSSPTLTNVTFSGNSAGFDGGGMLNLDSSPTLTNVTFSGNFSDYDGGGMFNRDASSPTLTNVTFNGNSAINSGGGMYNNFSSNPTLTNVTFGGNTAFEAGGILNDRSNPKIRNGILWGDSGGEIFNLNGSNPTVSDSVVQGGYVGGTNIITTDPKLAPLGNYGGFTQTMRLLPGSSAINAGNNCVLTANGCGGTHPAVTTDQRGVARPQNSAVDIGAVEANYALAATGGTPQSTLPNTSFANPLITTLTEFGLPVSGVAITFAAPGSGASATFTGNPATTNASGQASVIATANNVIGSYQATAGSPGLNPATFNLANACSVTVNCPAPGPGQIIPSTAEANDQKAGSVLIYNVFTSGATSGNTQNTRINITNTHPQLPAFVHLFFVAEGCSVADSYLCLTANQTASFLASDLDPGTSGYLVAVAVDGVRGCPTSFNYLIGDEYVKFSTGHAANLGAQAFSAIAGGLPVCDGNSVTTQLDFNGVSYNRIPATLALSNIGSRADGNDTLLIVNRIGGNLGIGASTLGSLFGILYDDAENALSFSVAGNCQLRNSISNNFPRTTPRFESFIPAGRTGWLKIFNQTGSVGITGAAINFNANAASSAGAFNQGHNLHGLTLTTSSYVIPVFPPSC